MLDSSGHDDSKKEGESDMGKIAEFSVEQTSFRDQSMWYLYKIYKATGIHPTEFKSLDQYLEAVIATMETESIQRELTSEEGTDMERIREIFQNELKRRGELS